VITTRFIDESLLNAMSAYSVNSIQQGEYRQVRCGQRWGCMFRGALTLDHGGQANSGGVQEACHCILSILNILYCLS